MTVTAIVKNGEIVTIFYGSTTSSGNDKAEIAGDVTTENIASKNELFSWTTAPMFWSPLPTTLPVMFTARPTRICTLCSAPRLRTTKLS